MDMELKTERIELRVTPSQKVRMQATAKSYGMNVSEYLIEFSTAASEGYIQTQFLYDDEAWDEINARFDRPAEVKPGLAKLFQEHADHLKKLDRN